jgi:endonuclease YncB( thermonuclease family)
MKTLSFIFILLISVASTTSFKGKVVKITDGDTIVVLTDKNEQIKVRLEGIDCPESNQDYGTQAKKATSDLCFGKQVEVIKTEEDIYGRTLGHVYVGEVCVNKELLKMGLAWHYKQYNKDQELAKLETEAREKRVGLWSMKDPVAPWDFRHKK